VSGDEQGHTSEARCPESRRLRVLLHGEDYSDAYEALVPQNIAICPHPSPTNLCRLCDIANRAEWHRQNGREVSS
jgi:hypothetical protein